MARNIQANALIILRVLDEYGEGDFSELECREILRLSGLSKTEFDRADTYLLQRHLVDGTQGGLDGSRSLEAEGHDYLHNVMATRYSLSLAAEQILTYLSKHHDSSMHGRPEWMKELSLDQTYYDEACRELAAYDFIQPGWQDIGLVIALNQKGRQAVMENFQKADIPSTQVTFDQRGQQVTYQYNAARDINIGAVQNKVELIDQLEKLKTEVSKAEAAEIIDAEIATDARYEIERAVNLAKKATPDKKTVIERLEGAARLLQGITAAAGLIEALGKAVEQVQKLNLF
jgi:hypothetical protein